MSESQTRTPDDVTAAVQTAKDFLLLAFKDEKLDNLGLEEVRHNHGTVWDVTLGFSRHWEPAPASNAFLAMAVAAAAARRQRTYKVVQVDLAGPKGLAISNHPND